MGASSATCCAPSEGVLSKPVLGFAGCPQASDCARAVAATQSTIDSAVDSAVDNAVDNAVNHRVRIDTRREYRRRGPIQKATTRLAASRVLCSGGMDHAWPKAVAEGFAIAAIVHDDPGAMHARAGLTADAVAPATELADRLRAQPAAERRAFLRTRLSQPTLDLDALAAGPARARASLASQVDRELGRQWLLSSMPRPGYQAPPSLDRLLRKLASRART